MPRRLKAVSHEDRLTLVEHLDELRNRLLVALAVFVVALAFCLWQSHMLLEAASAPLPSDHERLLTLGVTEPFVTTLMVAIYGALILSLPILLIAPLLFLAGVVFAYFIVMPAAVDFLLGFNDSQFNVQVRARDYYGFFAMTLLAGGVVFQLPLAILAVTRLGIVSVAQLTANRRYAYLAIAALAAMLPGVDPISMLIEMVPLLILYELSILLARAFGTPKASGGIAKPSTQER